MEGPAQNSICNAGVVGEKTRDLDGITFDKWNPIP